MRRFLLMSCVVVSCALSGVQPAVAVPEPPAITVATTSDDVAHPGSATEWWYVSVIDPATGATFIAQQFTAPFPVTNSFFYAQSGAKAHMTSSTTQPVTTSAPSVCSNAMCLTYDAGRRAYHLEYAANGVTADLWLDAIRPGVTTQRPLVYDEQQMYWTVPVATSTASGWVWPVGAPTPISVDGWRGYHDHDWGSFDLADQRYTGWEWGISHHPDGSAQLMGGVIGGDGRWQGVMAKVTPTATTFCQSDSSVDPTALTLSEYSTHQGFHDAWEGRFQYDAFDVEGLVPVAYALFAFGVATAAGAILRRSLPAFGVAFGAFLAARMAVALLARPAYATPLTTMEPVPVGGSKDQAGHRPVAGFADWVIEHGYADATGRRLSWTEYYELEDAANRAGTNLNQFLHARGIQQFGSTTRPTGSGRSSSSRRPCSSPSGRS